MSDESEEDDDALEMYWDDLRVARHRVPPRPDVVAEFRELIAPGDLAIGTSPQRPLVIIKPDGQLHFGPEYRPEEAAMVFWEALGRHRYPYEEQILVIQHMEAILMRVGEADLHLEQLRLAAQQGDVAAARQAGHAQVRLERAVHQAIELGRGLCRRPEIPIPDVPERIPARVGDNPQSDYEGREGLEPSEVPSTASDVEDNS